MVFPKSVVVSSPGGSNAVHKTDWSPLRGRARILIWGDADDAGHKFVANVSAALHELDIPQILTVDAEKLASIDPRGGTRCQTSGWDVADALAEGWEPHALRKEAFDNATQLEKRPRYISFENFTMQDDGLFAEFPRGNGKNRTLESIWIASPFEILGRVRHPNGEGWARWVRWRDDDGRAHTQSISDSDLHGDVGALCANLASRGLRIVTGPSRLHLVRYLNQTSVEKRVTLVTRTGWHDIGTAKIFALPDESIGALAGETVIVQGGVTAPFEQRGTLADWQRGVGKLASGHSRAVFAVSIGFAGPLLGLLGLEGGGFNFFGQSSRGKSTIAEAAASVWGKGSIPGYVRSWRSTANALEAIAAIHSDALLVLDELGVVEAREAASATYQLSSGSGKGRAARDGSFRTSQTWRTMIISTGELRMSDKLVEGHQRARAGQQVRLVDIPAHATNRFGVFDHGGPDRDGKSIADALKSAARSYYGTAGPAFVRQVIADGIDKNSDDVRAMVAAFQTACAPSGADAQVLRVCDRFGIVAAAGELAREYGIVPWDEGEARDAALRCFKDWLDSRGGAEAGETRAAVSQVRLFIEQHGDARFENLKSSDRPVNNRAGWRRGEGTEQEWLIPGEVWKSEVAVGFDPVMVARVLAERGMLKRANDGFQRPEKVQGRSTRVYVITAKILEHDHE
jgi:putative DNA primase/helicase